MRSIRRSLLTGTAVAVPVICVAAGVVLDRGVRAALWTELDRSLEERARLVASTVDVTNHELDADLSELDFGPNEGHADAFLWLFAPDDALLYATAPDSAMQSIHPRRLSTDLDAYDATDREGRALRVLELTFVPRVDPDDEEAGSAVERVEESTSEEDDEAREASEGTIAARSTIHIVDDDIPALTLVVARETEQLDALLGKLRAILVIVGLAAGALLLATLRVVIGRSLRPLLALAREIESLDETRLTERVELPDAPLEIVPVRERINRLLERIGDAFAREKTLTADMAHELRTPLAGLRTSIEVELARPRTEDEYRAALVEALEIVERMHEMVQTLLYLGRLDAGHVKTETQKVDLGESVRRAWAALEPLARSRGLTVSLDLAQSAELLTDPTLLDPAIRNVLENAVVHADTNGRVEVHLTGTSGTTALRVTNTGSRIAQEDVESLFGRFARGDAGRGETGVHCGLGLALVSRIASVLGLTTRVTTVPGETFTIELSTP